MRRPEGGLPLSPGKSPRHGIETLFSAGGVPQLDSNMAHELDQGRLDQLAQSGARLALLVDDAAWIWIGENGAWVQHEGAMEGYTLTGDEMAEYLQEQEALGVSCLQTTATSGSLDHDRTSPVSSFVRLTTAQIEGRYGVPTEGR